MLPRSMRLRAIVVESGLLASFKWYVRGFDVGPRSPASPAPESGVFGSLAWYTSVRSLCLLHVMCLGVLHQVCTHLTAKRAPTCVVPTDPRHETHELDARPSLTVGKARDSSRPQLGGHHDPIGCSLLLPFTVPAVSRKSRNHGGNCEPEGLGSSSRRLQDESSASCAAVSQQVHKVRGKPLVLPEVARPHP